MTGLLWNLLVGPDAQSLVPAPFGNAEVDGLPQLIMRFFAWTAVWVLLWYILSCTQPLWGSVVAPSEKPHENDRYWMVRNLIGVIHALFVAAIAIPALLALSRAPDDVRFAASSHLETCAMDPDFYPGENWGMHIEAVALAGLAFTAFTTADVVLSMLHGLATVDYMVHHAAFILAGLLLRGNCMLPWKGSVQLAMEASTPFLNIMLFYQNRGAVYRLLVILCGTVFVASYVYFRLIQNTYATALLWLRGNTAFPSGMPRWEMWLAIVACTAGAAVQFFWFPAIVRTLFKATLSRIDKREAYNEHFMTQGHGNQFTSLVNQRHHVVA